MKSDNPLKLFTTLLIYQLKLTWFIFFIFFERYPAYVLFLNSIAILLQEIFFSFAMFAGLYFSFLNYSKFK